MCALMMMLLVLSVQDADTRTVLRLEDSWASALVKRDSVVFNRLLAPGFVYTENDQLMDGMQTGRAEMLKLEQDQNREMASYLSPVQQARYQQMRERLMQRVGELRMQRREGQGMGRGRGMGTGRPGINRGPRRRGI